MATVLFGGNGDKPHAWASSDATDSFVDLVRNEWPDNHLVTRMDASEDFIEAGCFNRLRPVLRRVAQKHGLAFPRVEDELNKHAGRTQYIGSGSSDYQAKLYEKGWEQAAKAASHGLDPRSITGITNVLTGEVVRPEDWSRLELRARPRERAGREIAARLTPEQAWALTPWAHEIASEALALDLERVVIRTKKHPEDEKALRWMCKHYGKVLTRLRDSKGGWEGAGVEIGRFLAEQEVFGS